MLRSNIIFIAGSLASVLSGCATAPTESEAGASPSNYKMIVRDYLRTTLVDPYSVRDAQIAPPRLGQIHIAGTMRHETGWTVCVRANAKNRMGGYTGLKPMVVLIKNDQGVGSISDADHYDVRTNCSEARYEPFPELDGQDAMQRRR